MDELNLVYAGIGSRETPYETCDFMQQIGAMMGKRGFILRSGAAKGADAAFEAGCDSVKGRKMIYLPWKGFNGNTSPFHEVSEEAFEIARGLHPAWDECTEGARKLLARNVYQMLGLELDYKSRMVLLWTDNEDRSGTGFAIRIANEYDIPWLNIHRYDGDQEWMIGKVAAFIADPEKERDTGIIAPEKNWNH